MKYAVSYEQKRQLVIKAHVTGEKMLKRRRIVRLKMHLSVY